MSESLRRLQGQSPLRLTRRIRLAGVLLTILVISIAPFDTAFGLFDGFYPNSEPPRTHPLTWLSLVLATWATLSQKMLRTPPPLEHALWLAVILLVTLKPLLGPMVDDLVPNLRLGTMGLNTALTLSLIAIGQLLYSHRSIIGTVCAISGVFLPCVALNGIILGKEGFYGQMAAPTAIALFGLGIANIMRYSRRQGFRLILRQSPAGRLVRHQMALWAVLTLAMMVTLRLVDLTKGSGFAMIYTALIAIVLAGIVYFGMRFAGLLENARRIERDLLREAETDPLTGVATRRAAVSYFIKKSWKQPIGVILLDLDHFKQINDRHGHAVGDKVLQTVAQHLRSAVRLSDLVARWGGEEFLILVKCDDAAALRTKADRLRAGIETATAADTFCPTITASVGAALAKPGLEPDMAAFVAQADAALYEAKAAGRNRLKLAGDEPAKPKLIRAA